MVLSLYSRAGLARVFEEVRQWPQDLPGEARQLLALSAAYLDTIDPVVAFLQGRDPSLAPLICQGCVLPQGPRFTASRKSVPQAQAGSTGSSGTSDYARHLASLYLEDIADLVAATVSPYFALSRYAEQVATLASSFDPIAAALEAPLSVTDEWLLQAVWRQLEEDLPDVIGLTVPFPGNLYGALRVAQAIKFHHPHLPILLGGGYVNTELRRLQDPRLFDLVDFVTLDDGERPLLCVLEHLQGTREDARLRRTFVRRDGRVVWRDGAREPEFGMADVGTPTYDGLPLERYLSILDTLNPMHRLWSDGHWNKLTVAHGCYWKQCTFCDVGLDYIGRYEATPSQLLIQRIEALIAETGRRGFHFVDEAAPPAALKALALGLLERGVVISWWGNIRFEPAFTTDLSRLLAASGCVAVTAGLEVAADRLLDKMKKGINVDRTARVAAAFRGAGIMVHAYLMYGFPSETLAEAVDSLERVRQLFAAELVQSAFWHRFVATAHSPVGLDPAGHGIRILGPEFAGFAENDFQHVDMQAQTPEWFGEGLRRALYAYMEGQGFTADVRSWFEGAVPKPKVSPWWVRRALAQGEADGDDLSLERRLVWIGGMPVQQPVSRTWCDVIVPNRSDDAVIRLRADRADWFCELLQHATPRPMEGGVEYPRLADVQAQYPFGGRAGFGRFVRTNAWTQARAMGLLLI